MRIYAKYANHIRESFRVHTQTISRTYAKYANHFAYIRKLFRVNTRNTRTISRTYANHFAYIREPFCVHTRTISRMVRVLTQTSSRTYAKLTPNQLVPRWQSTSQISPSSSGHMVYTDSFFCIIHWVCIMFL